MILTIYEDMEYDIVTNLTCPKCESYVEVYHKIQNIMLLNEQDAIYAADKFINYFSNMDRIDDICVT